MAARRAQRHTTAPSWVQELQWSAEQLAVLERAARLRAYGATVAAGELVATGCPIPERLHNAWVAAAVRLDVARWYAAFTGRAWDGSVDSLRRARGWVSHGQ